MYDSGAMSVDDIETVDAAYIPYIVVYNDLDHSMQHNLLIFAEDMKRVSFIADGFLTSLGVEYIILSIAIMNVQFTLVQKDEPCPSGTDELDDPIRR